MEQCSRDGTTRALGPHRSAPRVPLPNPYFCNDNVGRTRTVSATCPSPVR